MAGRHPTGQGDGERRSGPPSPPPRPPRGLRAAGAPTLRPPGAEGTPPLPKKGPRRGAEEQLDPHAAGPSAPRRLLLRGSRLRGGARTSAPERHADHAQGWHAATNQSSMGAVPPMTRASPVTPEMLPTQRGRRKGLGLTGPPGEQFTGRPPPPPPGRPHPVHRAAPRPRPNAHAGGECADDERRGRAGNRRPPPRGRAEGPRRPPPPAPHQPRQPTRRGGAGLHPPGAEGMVPPPPGRTAAPEGGGGARPAPPPQLPAPAETVGNKRTRANAPGRHTGRAQRQQASINQSGMRATPSMTRTAPVTPALLPAQGRQRDGTRQSSPPPQWPPRPHKRGARRTGDPPLPPYSPARERPGRADPPHEGAHNPKQGRGETETGCPPPKHARRSKGPGQDTRRGTDHVERAYQRPAPGPREVHAPHHPGEGGAGSGPRGSASAQTHKGHAGNTRRATGPSSRNAQAAWNAVPASEGKGHPDRTARHTQRGIRGAGRGERGRRNTRYQPGPPKPAASAAHTRTGHCTRQGSSGALRHAPTPRLGSHRASPRGSHWRQASSTGPAAPAPQATTH